MVGLEPAAYALEGHCSFHLSYIPMCVSISCMPTFKALTQRNTYGYFFNVGHPPVTYVLSWERPNPVGKRGIELPRFTAWELIYSQLQHRQSLPLSRNARTPHSISLYATALRIQYQISSAPSERKDSNLQSGSRCCFPCTRHFYQLSYVPKPPSDG